MIDQGIAEIIDKGLLGKKLTDEQLLTLLELETFSPEAAYLRWAGRHLARVASGATAQIYAEINLDSLPCPTDCGFCALAKSRGVRTGGATKRMITKPDGTHEMVDVEPDPAAAAAPAELTAEQAEARILPAAEAARLARAFDQAGVHLISLHCTDALPFERLAETVRAVRDAVSKDMPLMVDRKTLTADQARELAAAGAQAARQSIFLGEAAAGNASADASLQVIRHIRDANLELMACVEPVHRGVPATELLAAIRQVLELKPFCSTVNPLVSLTGSRMEQYLPVSAARAELVEAVARLVAGVKQVKHGFGGGNVRWIRTGATTCGRTGVDDDALIARRVADARAALEGQEWSVPSRPLTQWFPASEEALKSIASAPVGYTPILPTNRR
ncbi:MAG: hypothetical protein Q4D06_01005, partial [Coriobacteriia bacterium]|nr:hypothetical protein [Coriobacteriia bacterium]